MAKGSGIPRACVPIGETGRVLALNEYNGKVGLVVGRVFKGSFYIDFVKKELNDGREFNVPLGPMGWTSREELVDQLVRLAEKISTDEGSQKKGDDDTDNNGDEEYPF